MFPTIDEVHDMLDEISEEIPKEFYDELNGGILLEEGVKYHPESIQERPLYILGEYRTSMLGKSIAIYYGSFKKAFLNRSYEYIYGKLRHALIHEFTHHMEGRAGEDDLIVSDVEDIENYREIIKKYDK